MPNGFHGPKSAWEQLVEPLKVLDPELEPFARDHGFELLKNEREWASRSMHWKSKGLGRSISIFLDEKQKGWKFWVCASKEMDHVCYWKNVYLKDSVPIEK